MSRERTAARVRQLIEDSGLTQADFAGRAGLDASKMSKSLSGVRRFTSLDLARIADLSGVSVDWLLGADPMTPSIAARISTPPSTSETAIREAERLAQLRADLAFLGYQQSATELDIPRMGTSVDQGRELALQAARHASGMQVALWQHRDLAKVIEKVFGVDVSIQQLPDGFDGLSWADDTGKLIVVGTSEIPTRQRFTLMHELGHILAGDDDQRLHLDENIHDADHRRKPSEKRANAFAAELLLPAAVLRTEAAAHPAWPREAFAELACRLWVSPSTLAWRLLNLELINRSQCESLRAMTTWDAAMLAGTFDAYSEWLARTSAPQLPGLLIRATAQAYIDGKSTLRPLANLLSVDTDTLRRAISDAREGSPLAS